MRSTKKPAKTSRVNKALIAEVARLDPGVTIPFPIVTGDELKLQLVKALFAEMRSSHVFVFRGLGLSIQMSQTAWDLPRAEQPQSRGEQEVSLEDMPPELAGPFMAFRRNPTHPDAPVNDAAEQGDDLPGED